MGKEPPPHFHSIPSGIQVFFFIKRGDSQRSSIFTLYINFSMQFSIKICVAFFSMFLILFFPFSVQKKVKKKKKEKKRCTRCFFYAAAFSYSFQAAKLMRGRTELLQGTRGLLFCLKKPQKESCVNGEKTFSVKTSRAYISPSGKTMTYTWTVSMLSVLSHTMRDSFTLRISASWSKCPMKRLMRPCSSSYVRHVIVSSFRLTGSERGRPAAVLVPETITETQITEGLALDATKDRSDHGARSGLLRDTARPEINVVGRGKDLSITGQSVVGENTGQIVPALGGLQTAILAESIVAGHTVLTTALHVHGSQIGTKVVLVFTEQVVGQLEDEPQLDLNPDSIDIHSTRIPQRSRRHRQPGRPGSSNQQCKGQRYPPCTCRKDGWRDRSTAWHLR